MQDKVLLFRGFLNESSNAANEEELNSIVESYLAKLNVSPEDEIYKLWNDILILVKENFFLKSNGADAARSRKIAALSAEEKAMLAEVEKVINENRFGYHFQPIVNATDGSIYSYEALMRPQSEMKLAPYHVLKYAELMGRLNDIERATFLNVLNTIDSNREAFGDSKVFINSIPKTKLDSEDFRHMGELMMKHSDTVVVELTENAEFNEDELRSLQERYRNWDIKIALDDYGTGYSNVQNLLRYNPNYVKIDRTLLTEIQNSPKKKHFVREIIDFCHDNNIMALAEGVETSEELRTVILLGADLIQGYYTSRPSAEIMESIPYEIRQEITIYQQERQDGKDQQVYAAENTERIQLDKLVKDDYLCILVGKESAEEDGEVTIVGSASLDTEIHIEVAEDFKGRLVLQNAHLSNVKNRPCINLSENSDVTLELNGENKLNGGGIRVPEGAKLTVRGDGKLDINLEAVEYFAIGNDTSSGHGDIDFEHIGMVCIRARGKTGVCIGSGLGGNTVVGQGKIMMNVNGNTGVGIGSLYGDVKFSMSSCSIDADMSLMNGVAVGSMTGSAEIHARKCSSRFSMSGRDLTAVGTIGGDKAEIHINDAIMTVNISGYHCTGVGSLNKKTDFRVETGAFRATVAGETALAFGGFSKDTTAAFLNSDSSIDLNSKNDPTEYIAFDRIENVGGRTSVIVNGHEIDIRALEQN